MDRVRELMTPQPVTVQPDTPIVECATKMMELGLRHLPVVDAGELTGLVDDGGVFSCGVLVDGALWFRFDPLGPETAADVARAAVTLDVEADLGTALRTLRGYGAAVVLDNHAIVGVLSEADVVAVASTIVPADRKVDDVASSPVHTVPSEMGSQEALHRMRDGRVRHLVVADDGVAVGVVSLRDLVASWRGADVPVERVMGVKLHTVETGSTLADAAHQMHAMNIGCMPILDADGRPVAIVTRSDVLDAVAGSLDDEALFGDD